MTFRRGHLGRAIQQINIYEETEKNITFVNFYNFSIFFFFFTEYSIPFIFLKYLSLVRTTVQKYSHIFTHCCMKMPYRAEKYL